MNWNYKNEGRGIAGTYENEGWTVWSAGSGWKITKPNGFTYSREYKTANAAMRNADKLSEKSHKNYDLLDDIMTKQAELEEITRDLMYDAESVPASAEKKLEKIMECLNAAITAAKRINTADEYR